MALPPLLCLHMAFPLCAHVPVSKSPVIELGPTLETSFNLITPLKTYLQIQLHLEVLEARASTFKFWRDTKNVQNDLLLWIES